MRVIAGQAKGHRLKMPDGRETRPTSDKVREAIFGILGLSFKGAMVLDFFAGSGALGIEALSRGASSAVFVEKRRVACQIIHDNLVHTRLSDGTRVLCMPVERAIPMLSSACGLVLLDPPYAYPTLHDIMAMVSGAQFTSSDTIVVLEHSPRFTVERRYARLNLSRQKVYGDTAVSIFVVQEDESL
jgi:16S rRNA (guanine966-N2)-methyltransferase